MSRMILITDDDALWGFGAFGLEISRVYGDEDFRRAWDDALNGGYDLVFLTEGLAAANPGLLEAADRDDPFPIVTLLPGGREGKGLATRQLRQAVIRALGSDLVMG